MGDPRSVLEGSSASMDDSCPWTEVSASNAQHSAPRHKEHLDFFLKYDRSAVSVGRKIGEGGQGCVYEAKLHLPYFLKPLPVAVKKFKPLEGFSQGQFPREMVSAKSYFLCKPYGVFFEGDSLCMIMERYSCDLRVFLETRMKALREEVPGTNGPPFKKEGGEFIIFMLAMGLKALHECGVYHGDLKAANILVKTYGKNNGTPLDVPANLAIADFERSKGVVGTAFWRAPEVLRSLVTDVPLSKEQWLLADVYSFGMVCYEVLTGMIPFHGHPVSDYGLVLNGGRPELPDHVPEPMRDLIVRCWHADPHSRPNWSEIMEVLATNVDVTTLDRTMSFTHSQPNSSEIMEVLATNANVTTLDRTMSFTHSRPNSSEIMEFLAPNANATTLDNTMSFINNLVSVESLSFKSLMHEAKQVVQDLMTLHESDSKSFGSDFMPYYWASEFLATAEEYASKFDVDSFPESLVTTCCAQEAFERTKLLFMLIHQMYGAKFASYTFFDLYLKGHFNMVGHMRETIFQKQRLQVMLLSIYHKVFQEFSKRELTNKFEIGTPWTGKLIFFHALVKWVLWYEHADYGTPLREAIWICLVHNSIIQALLFILCIVLNTYIYVLAMITYEPILLVLQYGLYKAKGCNNILYRSSGERICRFQRAWMNCTRYKLVGIILSFSFVTLVTMYGWRGILGWILFPCVIIVSPYWRRSIWSNST